MAAAGIGGRVEGVQAVRAALAARRVQVLYVERTRRDVERLVQEARRSGADVQLLDSVANMAETEAHQGLVAKARPIRLVPLDRLLTGSDEDPPSLLVLDHLEDPRNVGAIARSALAAGMTGMVVPRRRAAPLSALTFKAAAGALEQIPVSSVSSVAVAAQRASAAGVWTVGLDPSAPEPLFGLGLLTEPVALFVGSEARGLGRLVRERLDTVVSIPMAAGASNLNAGVAAALACFEVLRIRRCTTSARRKPGSTLVFPS